MRKLWITLCFLSFIPYALHADDGASCQLPTKAMSGYDYDISKDPFGTNTTAQTDYYKLAINWSPSFCKGRTQNAKNEFQCFSGNQFTWVLHGLWAQSCDGKTMAQCKDWKDIKKHPRLCKGDLPLVPYETIRPYLCVSPGADLLQGEWEKHGSCDFESAQAYFEKESVLFQELKLPPQAPFQVGTKKPTLDQKSLQQWLWQNNPSLKDKKIQTSGNEFYVCYDKNFMPINCPPQE